MIPAPARACLPFLLALAPLAAPGNNAPLVFPSGQLTPVDLTLSPKEPSSWRMPTLQGVGEPPEEHGPPDLGPVLINFLTKEIPVRDPGKNDLGPVRESDLKPRNPEWTATSEEDQPAIPALSAATLLDPFVVRDDRYRRAQEAIDSITISDGRFNVATGGRIAKLSLGSFKLELGLWKHDQVGPSYGPPIPVVNFLKFTW